MSCYAIATVRQTDGSIGVRLLNKESSKCTDISIKDIPFYKSKYKIDNIDISKKGELKWIHGTADRYPIIDCMMNTAKNTDSVIVLGSGIIGENKCYLVANYIGETTIVPSNELIAYGNKHKLANCKITKSKNQEFISGIGWTVEELRTEPVYKFYPDNHYLEIEIPFYNSDTLTIPDFTASGRIIEGVSHIKVIPAIMANKIKKLIITKNIDNITFGLVSSMPNLEYIESKSDKALIYDEAFVGLRKLKEAKFGGILYLGRGSFSMLKELKSVTSKIPPKQILTQAFRGCTVFNIESILTEGVMEVHSRAFENIKELKKLIIPSTIKYLDSNCFVGCSNLTLVNCLSESLDIGKRRSYSANSTEELFVGNINKIVMYIGKHARFNGSAGANVEVRIREETSRDKEIDKRIMKGNMVGMQIDTHKKIDSPEEVSKIIASARPSEVKSMVDTLIHNGFRTRWGDHRMEFDFSGMKIMIALPSESWYKAKSIKDIGKAYVLKGNSVVIIPYDIKLVKNAVKKSISLSVASKSRYYGIAAIVPIVVEAKYIKSIEIADNGMVRIIYNRPDTGVSVVDRHDYED